MIPIVLCVLFAKPVTQLLHDNWRTTLQQHPLFVSIFVLFPCEQCENFNVKRRSPRWIKELVLCNMFAILRVASAFWWRLGSCLTSALLNASLVWYCILSHTLEYFLMWHGISSLILQRYPSLTWYSSSPQESLSLIRYVHSDPFTICLLGWQTLREVFLG